MRRGMTALPRSNGSPGHGAGLASGTAAGGAGAAAGTPSGHLPSTSASGARGIPDTTTTSPSARDVFRGERAATDHTDTWHADALARWVGCAATPDSVALTSASRERVRNAVVRLIDNHPVADFHTLDNSALVGAVGRVRGELLLRKCLEARSDPAMRPWQRRCGAIAATLT